MELERKRRTGVGCSVPVGSQWQGAITASNARKEFMALTVSGSSQELAPSGWSNETVAPCRCATCKMCNVRDNTVGLSMEPAMFVSADVAR